MGRKFNSILETVGKTPVVRINRLAPPHVNLYVKIEAFNPLGSVKDRLALGVIEAAEKSGQVDELQRQLLELASEHNKKTGGGTSISATFMRVTVRL